MNSFTIDLETENLAKEIGGWEAPPGDFGITTVCGWSSETGRPHFYGTRREEINALVVMLEAHDCIISFNGVHFDVPVIEGVYGEKITIKRHIDLLQLIWEAHHGERETGYKLKECGPRTLGIEKSGESVMAPELARQGRWNELLDYCLGDVIITRKLALFAQKEGGIVAPDGSILKLTFPDWFQDLSI